MSAMTYAVSDTATLTGRMLKHNIRSIDTVMTVLITPIMILLAFVFVIGGAISIPGVKYVDYIMPVILLMTVASGVAYTAFRVNNDVTSGMFARLRTMPIARASILGGHVCWETVITTDHNHVALERHGDRRLWVHRKGAMPARLGEGGVLPGSMGSLSFHVEGRGHEPALCSSAHGSGRALSRTVAREKVTERELRRQMEGVWYDYRLANRLRDEAPAAYKDIRAVLRAQRELVKVTRTLRPVLNYKAT